MTKKILSLALILAMVLSIAPLSFAADEFEIIDGVLVKYNGTGGDVVIPDGVTMIGNAAFIYKHNLTSVAIPSSVTSISNSAFSSCSQLTSIYIPDSVTSIGSNAFAGCEALTEIRLSNSITIIESGAFYFCKALTSITIPNSVTTIKGDAFAYCYALTNIALPTSLKTISSAFKNCTALENIKIPDGVITIGRDIFSGCTALTSIEIPDSVTSIALGAFNDCTSLSSVKISNSVNKIASSIFSNCTSLARVIIPNSVKTIEPWAFQSCTSLTNVTIPDSVTSIGHATFSDCTSLTSIVIPSSVTGIASNAFYNCNLLTTVTIPESVKTIGTNAFGYYAVGSNNVKLQGFTISGISGSAAEKYAADNGFTFISLGAPAPVTYTVTFTDWDGTVLRAQTVEKGQPAIAPSVPVRAGYTFLSWSGTFDNVTADVTVTAQYTKIDTFVVTFKDWNGEILKTEVIEVGESAIAPSAPKRTGYTFSGWDKSFTGVTSNLTITAQYKKDEDPASAPSSWAAADIAKAKELKLSTTELEANYQANTTRAEFCRLAVNFVEIYYGKSISEVLANKKLTLGKFSDTNDSAILAANALGIVAGIGDGSFNPKGTLTREQAAVMLTMTLEAIGIDTSADADANFADNSATASWAQNSVNSVFSRGIMAGTGNNNFAAKESYTHEQSIATILRLYNNTK